MAKTIVLASEKSIVVTERDVVALIDVPHNTPIDVVEILDAVNLSVVAQANKIGDKWQASFLIPNNQSTIDLTARVRRGNLESAKTLPTFKITYEAPTIAPTSAPAIGGLRASIVTGVLFHEDFSGLAGVKVTSRDSLIGGRMTTKQNEGTSNYELDGNGHAFLTSTVTGDIGAYLVTPVINIQPGIGIAFETSFNIVDNTGDGFISIRLIDSNNSLFARIEASYYVSASQLPSDRFSLTSQLILNVVSNENVRDSNSLALSLASGNHKLRIEICPNFVRFIIDGDRKIGDLLTETVTLPSSFVAQMSFYAYAGATSIIIDDFILQTIVQPVVNELTITNLLV